jgi:hypothetical protein
MFMDANPILFFFDLGLSLVQPLRHETRFAALRGKIIWVTGASSGIGAELVCHLVAAEAKHGKDACWPVVYLTFIPEARIFGNIFLTI